MHPGTLLDPVWWADAKMKGWWHTATGRKSPRNDRWSAQKLGCKIDWEMQMLKGLPRKHQWCPLGWSEKKDISDRKRGIHSSCLTRWPIPSFREEKWNLGKVLFAGYRTLVDLWIWEERSGGVSRLVVLSDTVPSDFWRKQDCSPCWHASTF